MTNIRRRILINTLKLFDLGVIVSAFLVAAVLASQRGHNIGATEFFAMRVKIQNIAIFASMILLWHIVFCFLGLYASRRLANRWREMLDIVIASALGTSVICLARLMFHISLVTPWFIMAFWITSTLLILSSRLTIRLILGVLRRRGRNLRHVIIVGTNTRALEFAERLVTHPELGYRILGFVDQEWPHLDAFANTGYPLLCDIASFPAFLRQSIVDEVVIGLPFRSMHGQASFIATACEEQGITVRVLSNIFNLKTARATADELEGHPLLTHSAGWVDGWPLLAKRILDVAVSFVAIVAVSPILIAAALAIKLTSRGPILFQQERVGLHKRLIRVYKLRTMVVDAERRLKEISNLNEVSGPVFKIKNDPRVTPIGRILRKTSIDELPQLFNVLKGEMSLVGPRPLPVRDYEGFSEDWQRRRFSVKPGITCLWQVYGRSSIPFGKWMELDLQYIDKWSLWLDFQILLQTIPAVLRGSGAA